MVFKKINLYKSFLLSLAVSHSTFAQFIPPEFQHFYEFEESKVLFLLPNDSSYESLAYSNYYGLSGVADPDALRIAILNSGIKEEYVDDIINALTLGKNLEQENGVSTSYYFEKKTMVLKVPAVYLDGDRKADNYTTIAPDDSAFIVANQFYGNYYDGTANATVNTNITAGLGSGYISGDFSLSGGDEPNSTLDSSRMFYEHNLNSIAFRVGYDEYGVEKNNSTSNLDYTNSNDNYYVSIGSSDNLFISDERDYKNIYFDIKGTGTVQVLREGRTIYTQSFLKGQHGISYKHLPRGNYNVELVIRADGYPEERFVRRVNNNVAQTSHNGYDYNVTVRNSSYDSGFEERGQESSRLTYGDASLTKSLLHDAILVGVVGQSDGDSIGLGGLVKYSNGPFDVNTYYNKLADGRYYSGSLNISSLSLDYQNYGGFDNQDVSNVSSLQRTMYGVQPFTQATLSYSFPILSSSITLYGSRTQYDDAGSMNGFESQNLALDYNTIILKNLQLNLGVSRTLNNNLHQKSDVENIYSANITIPLGDNRTTYSSGFDLSSQSGQRIVNSLTYDQGDVEIFDSVDTNASTSINSYIDGHQSELTLSGQVDLQNDQFHSGVYVNLSNHSATNLSINAQTTSVVTEDGIYQTNQNNEAYVIVESEAKGDSVDNKEKDFGILDSQLSTGYHTTTPINSATTVVGLNEFTSYKFQVDSEISGYKSSHSNHDVKSEMFSYPGSVHKISNKVEPIVTFLSYFEDFNDEALNDVKCIGAGCVSVGRVGEGIYSISIVENKPFKVSSDGEYCFVEPKKLNNDNVMTKCFPKIETQDNGMQLVVSGLGDSKEKIYYLGILNDVIPENILESSKLAKIRYIQYKFANNTHLFASSEVDLSNDESFDVVKKQVFEDIQNYVKSSNERNFFAENR